MGWPALGKSDSEGWSTKGNKGGGAGGTFLQKALEGAVVSALGLADFGSGGGKGAGWGKGAPADKALKGGPKGGGKGSGKGGGSTCDTCTPFCVCYPRGNRKGKYAQHPH